MVAQQVVVRVAEALVRPKLQQAGGGCRTGGTVTHCIQHVVDGAITPVQRASDTLLLEAVEFVEDVINSYQLIPSNIQTRLGSHIVRTSRIDT
ncbi:hypothetical protein SAMN02745181_3593 [Rubritalea squalenifaciens DSM 18772]|uniref:Uncharacterized protein n=1 Tax=Rubritalea squalenifaciens DSM 18772 TaxID=1123071 RepID=A0A1M6RAY3_9BACT|nr:hypothetical protein SAMN02745181_3593 [Rubritalea squalenifaciens DSM 18772]